MRDKNIAIVITDYGSYLNFLIDFAIELSNTSSYKVYVFASKNNLIKFNSNYTFENIVYCDVDFPRTLNIRKLVSASFRVKRLVRLHNITLVHAHFTSAIFASILFKVRSCTYWGTFHGLNYNVKKGVSKYLFGLIELFSVSRLDKTIVLNQYDYNCLKKIKAKKIVKTKSFGVGCKIENFPTKLSPFFMRKRENLVIGFTGRFVAFKGFDLLIRTFKLLEESVDFRVSLKLIGDFDPARNSGLTISEIKYLTSNENIRITGFIDNVQDELAECDIFLFLSRKEGLPVSLLEALSSGKLVVALKSRGVEDIITDEINGFLVDDNFSDDIIVKNIVQLLIEKVCFFNRYKNIVDTIEQDRLKYSRQAYINEQILMIKGIKNESGIFAN